MGLLSSGRYVCDNLMCFEPVAYVHVSGILICKKCKKLFNKALKKRKIKIQAGVLDAEDEIFIKK